MVYLGLGSNLANPRWQLDKACSLLSLLPKVTLETVSSVYRSEPLDGVKGPSYLNQVAQLRTTLPPEKLLDGLQAIENNLGRVRGPVRWASRVIDIDILLYDAMVMHTDRLTLPHYDMHRRLFFLKPLHEIAPHLSMPNGVSIRQLLANLGHEQIEKVE